MCRQHLPQTLMKDVCLIARKGYCIQASIHGSHSCHGPVAVEMCVLHFSAFYGNQQLTVAPQSGFFNHPRLVKDGWGIKIGKFGTSCLHLAYLRMKRNLASQ